jgi:hypothetical protein
MSHAHALPGWFSPRKETEALWLLNQSLSRKRQAQMHFEKTAARTRLYLKPSKPLFIKIKMVVLWRTMAAYVSNGRAANPSLNYQHISYKYSNTFVVIFW